MSDEKNLEDELASIEKFKPSAKDPDLDPTPDNDPIKLRFKRIAPEDVETK
jgi:hypothetical protein